VNKHHNLDFGAGRDSALTNNLTFFPITRLCLFEARTLEPDLDGLLFLLPENATGY
jgi:hypothetical protein